MILGCATCNFLVFLKPDMVSAFYKALSSDTLRTWSYKNSALLSNTMKNRKKKCEMMPFFFGIHTRT